MKPYVYKSEVDKLQGENAKTQRFLSSENGCTNGCCSGTTIYSSVEFSDNPGKHEDQEGFYVLEGQGFVRLGDLEFPINQGDSFIALPGVEHTIRTIDENKPVKVFWFHAAK